MWMPIISSHSLSQKDISFLEFNGNKSLFDKIIIELLFYYLLVE